MGPDRWIAVARSRSRASWGNTGYTQASPHPNLEKGRSGTTDSGYADAKCGRRMGHLSRAQHLVAPSHSQESS